MEWHAVDEVVARPSAANVRAIVRAIHTAWALPRDGNLKTWAYRLLGLESDARVVEVQEQAVMAIRVLGRVHDVLEEADIEAAFGDEATRMREWLDVARHRARYLKDFLVSEVAVRQCHESHFPPSLKLYEEPTDKKPQAYPVLLRHLLRSLSLYGYRRVDDKCYAEIRTADGSDSHAYKEAMTVMEFILRECDKDVHPEQWELLNAKGNQMKEELLKGLTMYCEDLEFPALEPNRGIVSFRNGIYALRQHCFYPFAERARWAEMAREWAAEREDMSNRVFEDPAPPTRHDVALNYFDIDFPVEHMREPFAAPTEEIDQILTHQQLDEETQRWVWAMLGRLLYQLKDKDNWQVIMFLKGIGGSGKSTLCDTVKYIFPKHTAASIGHGDRFMLGAVYKALLWYCTEVRRDSSMFSGPNAADLPRVIEGAEVSIEIKNKTAFTHLFLTPGLLAGNEMAGRDTAGALQRRYFVVEFNHYIPEDDKNPLLFEHIKENIAHILLKMNYSYLTAADAHGQRDIWAHGVLPQQIHDFKRNVSHLVDALARFFDERATEGFVLAADIQQPNQDVYVKWEEFRQSYAKFREVNGYEKQPLTADSARYIFGKCGITDAYSTLPYDGQAAVRAHWIFGIGLREHFCN